MTEPHTTATRCTQCQGDFTFTATNAGARADCPHCQVALILQAHRSAPDRSPEAVSGARMRKLQEIRAASCYPRLREFINLAAWLLLVAGCLWGVAETLDAVSYLGSSEARAVEPNVFRGLVTIALSFGFFLVFKPAASLLVDTADLLLEHTVNRPAPR